MENHDFQAIITKYRSNLFTIAFQYFKNSHDADDVVQEVFFRFYVTKKTFENDDHIKFWLIRVTINECKRILCSSFFQKTVPIEDYMQQLNFEHPEQSELFIAVMNLSKKYRMVIHLYYYEDYSTKEIAELLHIRETTVSTQLMRARAQLKKMLQEGLDDGQQRLIPRNIF